jgi:hypothetical protein
LSPDSKTEGKRRNPVAIGGVGEFLNLFGMDGFGSHSAREQFFSELSTASIALVPLVRASAMK